MYNQELYIIVYMRDTKHLGKHASKLAQNAKVYAEQAYNYEQHFDLLNDYIDKI